MENSRIKAIVYMSNAGHTKRYAELLSQATGLEAIELKSAKRRLGKGDSILYMGWLLAGQIKGFKEANGIYDIKAVCGVGMAPNGSQMNDVHKANAIDDSTQVFILQGGFDMDSLHGIYRFMMNFASKAAKKSLSEKKTLSEEDRQMVEMFANGKDSVSVENLAPVLDWYKGYAKQ